jgi:hypothetical protein
MDLLDHQDLPVYPVRLDLPELLDQRGLLELPEQLEPLVQRDPPVLLEQLEPLVQRDPPVLLEQLEPRVLQVLLVPRVQQGIPDPRVRLGLPERPEHLEPPELQALLDLVFITSKIPRQRHHIMMVIDGMIPQRDWNLFG